MSKKYRLRSRRVKSKKDHGETPSMISIPRRTAQWFNRRFGQEVLQPVSVAKSYRPHVREEPIFW